MKGGGGGHRLLGYPEDISGLMEVSREFARNLLCLPRLLGSSRELNTAAFACMARSSTPLYYSPVGGVPQLISAPLLMLPAEIESVSVGLSHILRLLKLVLLLFIEDFLHCKVRSFF